MAPAPRSAIAEVRAAAAASSTLSHPNVKSVALARSNGPSRNARAKAAQGHAGYQRIVAASVQGGRANRAQYKAAMAQVQTVSLASNTSTGTATPSAGTPTEAPVKGCPFSDFTVPVLIGSNVFQLIFDTGSSTLAVAGSSCTTCEGVSPLWSASSVSVDEHETATGNYGDNSGWDGEIYQDAVELVASSTATNAVAVTSSVTQRIVVITDQRNGFFTTDACDDDTKAEQKEIVSQGIIGMAFQSLASAGTTAFPDALWAQYPSQPRVFSVQVCEHSGNVWWGGYDTAAFSGTPVYTPLAYSTESEETYWTVVPATVYVGTTNLGFTTASWPTNGVNGGFNIVDTGTTLMELPTNVYNAVVQALIGDAVFQQYFRSASNNNFFDQPADNCEAATNSAGRTATGAELQMLLPTISIQFANGATITMDGVGSYILPCTNDYNLWVPGITASSDGGGLLGGWPLLNVRTRAHHCAIMHAYTCGLRSLVHRFLLCVFLLCSVAIPLVQQFITIYDADNLQVGFAPVTGSCGTSLAPRSAGATMIGDGSSTQVGQNDGDCGSVTGSNCTGTLNAATPMQAHSIGAIMAAGAIAAIALAA